MTAQPYQTAPAPDANDILMGGGGAPTAKFANPGDTVGGRIIAPPKSHQEREFDRNNPGKGAPKFFPSGDPIYGLTVDVQTQLRDPAITDDNGVRRIYVEGKRLKDAVRDAVYAGGGAKLEVGGELHVTFTGYGEPSNPGINPPKLYEARYTPASQAAVFGQQPTQQPAQQPTAAAPGVGGHDPWNGQPAQAPVFAQPTQAPAQTPPAQQPAAAPAAGGPSAEQVAAVKAAGLDPATVFPGYTGG